MMRLSFDDYRDKLLGCWNGKNIGGTLGMPFECRRGVFDVEYYTHDLDGNPIPNDDLDLQLVWLNAVEKYGRAVNASILGEYWLIFIVPNWNEYGTGKANLRAGIVPPLSGYVNNEFRDSCGSFILSEIWACLAPGHPEIAVSYAYEDSIVNHSNEGLYAEVFCAAVESAAFVESDTMKLINIGLSYIPKDCAVARGINCVVDSYKKGLSWQEARKVLFNEVPGSFGAWMTPLEQIAEDEPIAEMGFDAPNNIGIIIIGWLYGEGDFGKSICIATNCGEDADCTAGTLGAILGIINGNKKIDEKWLKPLGGNIKTLCIDKTYNLEFSLPETTEQLTDRVLNLTPQFLGSRICDYINAEKGYDINIDENNLYCRPHRFTPWREKSFLDVLRQSPFVVKIQNILFNVYVDYVNEPYVNEGEPRRIIISIENNLQHQQWLEVKWHLPEWWDISQKSVSVFLEQYQKSPDAKAEFIITPRELTGARHDAIVQIKSVGHHTQVVIPLTFYTTPNPNINSCKDQTECIQYEEVYS